MSTRRISLLRDFVDNVNISYKNGEVSLVVLASTKTSLY